VVIDMPVGPTAKVRSEVAADALEARFHATARALGMTLRVDRWAGAEPVGRGIGPALEARDVLEVLQGKGAQLWELRSRALTLSGALLEMGGRCPAGQGAALAAEVLADGRAWCKFQAICAAQGGLREPPVARHSEVVVAEHAGNVRRFDNRRIARLAKLAGAPAAKAAGLDLHVRLGDAVQRGQPLFTLYAEAPGELRYALDYLDSQENIIDLEQLP
jgi:thymidine phosphorylase